MARDSIPQVVFMRMFSLLEQGNTIVALVAADSECLTLRSDLWGVVTRFPKPACATVLCLIATAAIGARSPPNTTAPDDPDRERAFQLYGQHKFPEAVPLPETVIARYPTDVGAHEASGAALVSLAATEGDSTKAKAARLYARRELLRAKELGDTSDLSRILLAEIPENGRWSSFPRSPKWMPLGGRARPPSPEPTGRPPLRRTQGHGSSIPAAGCVTFGPEAGENGNTTISVDPATFGKNSAGAVRPAGSWGRSDRAGLFGLSGSSPR